MVQIGLQNLIDNHLSLLKNRRVGLVTHAAAVMSDYTHIVDALLKKGVQLTALWGPEHGFDGAGADATPIANATDARTGLPIFSLYGSTKMPTEEVLDMVDILVFDMQDIGARFYTFISTLVHVMRAAENQVPLIVLDRPNPINGAQLEGPLIDKGFFSFIGEISVPVRHGMTVGELARWIMHLEKLDLELKVVPMKGWSRTMWLEETGLPWIPLSPGMAHCSTTVVYPGTCLVEGTNLSEGRGTALPFEVLGAPWLDGFALAAALNQKKLPGVHFRAHAFTPTFGKYQDIKCGGVQVHVTDRDRLQPVAMGLEILAACRAQNPNQFAFLSTSWEGKPPHLDLLIGKASVRTHLEQGKSVPEITAAWQGEERLFLEERKPFLLYE